MGFDDPLADFDLVLDGQCGDDPATVLFAYRHDPVCDRLPPLYGEGGAHPIICPGIAHPIRMDAQMIAHRHQGRSAAKFQKASDIGLASPCSGITVSIDLAPLTGQKDRRTGLRAGFGTAGAGNAILLPAFAAVLAKGVVEIAYVTH